MIPNGSVCNTKIRTQLKFTACTVTTRSSSSASTVCDWSRYAPSVSGHGTHAPYHKTYTLAPHIWTTFQMWNGTPFVTTTQDFQHDIQMYRCEAYLNHSPVVKALESDVSTWCSRPILFFGCIFDFASVKSITYIAQFIPLRCTVEVQMELLPRRKKEWWTLCQEIWSSHWEIWTSRWENWMLHVCRESWMLHGEIWTSRPDIWMSHQYTWTSVLDFCHKRHVIYIWVLIPPQHTHTHTPCGPGVIFPVYFLDNH